MAAATRRSTIYLPADVHRALRLEAAAADRSISDLVSEAVRMSLSEVAQDLEAFEKRARERSRSFESSVKIGHRREVYRWPLFGAKPFYQGTRVTFLKNIWYVAAWSHELGADAPLAVTIIGEPIALYRRTDGTVVAFEDRCPHRHAPLSLGRIEGDDLRCMYHGLRFGCDGVCKEVPGSSAIPPRTQVRVFPATERSSWIWVWMGDPKRADPDVVPRGFGLDDPEWVMRAGGIDYDADYQLVNDNLCDLSHLDFVHETTLGASTGAKWSTESPKLTPLDDGLLFERWFRDHPLMPGRFDRVDTWNSYRYLLPGIFLMSTQSFPVGTAEASGLGPPTATAIYRRVDQQAVTPIGLKRTRYLYASGVEATLATPKFVEGVFKVVNASFAEDRRMIEGQQKIWDQTPPERQRAFVPQDTGPAMLRRMIAQRVAEER